MLPWLEPPIPVATAPAGPVGDGAEPVADARVSPLDLPCDVTAGDRYARAIVVLPHQIRRLKEGIAYQKGMP